MMIGNLVALEEGGAQKFQATFDPFCNINLLEVVMPILKV